MSVTVFNVKAFVPRPLPASPPFIQVSGKCPNATTLVAITIGDSHSSTTSGQILANSSIAAIFASTTSYNELIDCLNHMGTGGVQITITYTLTNGVMIVTAISCQLVSTNLLGAIQNQVTALVSTSAQISDRLEKDLSGAVLAELRKLNQHVGEALDLFRSGVGAQPPGRSPVESDFNDLIQTHSHAGEGESAWPGSSNGLEAEAMLVEEREAV